MVDGKNVSFCLARIETATATLNNVVHEELRTKENGPCALEVKKLTIKFTPIELVPTLAPLTTFCVTSLSA